MKKTRPTKKLTLNKESIRKLSDAELRRVVGAGPTQPPKCGCIHTSAGPSHPIFC